MKHVLAHRDGIRGVLTILAFMGDLSPCCGKGTRKTSKRWARCRGCGGRVERRDLPPLTAS